LRLTTVDGAAHEVVARLYPGIYDGALGESGRGGEGDPDEEGEEGETGAGGEDTGEITGGDAETGLEEAVQ
jgi:hypothetical protein